MAGLDARGLKPGSRSDLWLGAFTKKVDSARKNIIAIRQIVAANDSRRKERLEAITQVLLFAIACVQLLPSITATPLKGPAHWVLIGVS